MNEGRRAWTKILYIRTEKPGMGVIDTAGVNTTLAVDVAVTDPIKSNENIFLTAYSNEPTNCLSVLSARIQNPEVSS